MEGLQYGIQQGYNPMAAGAYASQFAPQGLLNNVAGAPLAGLIGSGIAGLLASQNLIRQPGQFVDGFGGNPYSVDPVTAYLQQIQLAQQQAQLAQQGQFGPQGQFAPQGQFGPQGWLGNHGGILGNPYIGNQQFGNPLALLAGQPGQLSPFGIDPVAAAYAQQRAQLAQLLALQFQLAPQGQFGQGQLGQQGQFGQGQFGQGQYGQGWYGQVPGQIGSGIGNPWLNSQLASPIGNLAGQGIRMGASAGYGGLPAY